MRIISLILLFIFLQSHSPLVPLERILEGEAGGEGYCEEAVKYAIPQIIHRGNKRFNGNKEAGEQSKTIARKWMHYRTDFSNGAWHFFHEHDEQNNPEVEELIKGKEPVAVYQCRNGEIRLYD